MLKFQAYVRGYPNKRWLEIWDSVSTSTGSDPESPKKSYTDRVTVKSMDRIGDRVQQIRVGLFQTCESEKAIEGQVAFGGDTSMARFLNKTINKGTLL